jgi:hypothetical protein
MNSRVCLLDLNLGHHCCKVLPHHGEPLYSPNLPSASFASCGKLLQRFFFSSHLQVSDRPRWSFLCVLRFQDCPHSYSVLPHSLICSAVHGRRCNMEKIVSWFACILSFLWFGLIGKKRNPECMSWKGSDQRPEVARTGGTAPGQTVFIISHLIPDYQNLGADLWCKRPMGRIGMNELNIPPNFFCWSFYFCWIKNINHVSASGAA